MPERIGERLCLNFTNTIEPRGGLPIISHLSEEQRASQCDYLKSYSDFLAWCILARIVRGEEALSLQEQARKKKPKVDETFQQIIALRELLYTVFWRMASTQVVEEQELASLQRIYLDALAHARLIKADENYLWHWNVEREHLISPSGPLYNQP